MKRKLLVLRTLFNAPMQLVDGVHQLARTTQLKLSMLLAAILCSSLASAYTVPTAGDFGYDFYDILITKGTAGPLGFVGAGILGLMAVAMLRTQWVVSIMCVLGAAAIVKMDDILVTLGAVV